MNLLMLPGNSKSNEGWIEEVRAKIGSLFEESEILYYDHWQNGNSVIDFEVERKKLSGLIAGWDEYLIFAKSVGTLLALAGTHDQILRPKAALFCGLPRSFADQIGYTSVDADWQLADFPITLLQNEFDPIGSYLGVKKYLAKVGATLELIKTGGDTHDYQDYNLIKDKLTFYKNLGQDKAL